MRLNHILAPERILLDTRAADRDAVLRLIARQFAPCHPEVSEKLIFERLEAREQTGSTGLGNGVAIPHARLDSDAPPTALFVRAQRPIAFNAPDGIPVRLFFALAVPLHSTQLHLELLSEVAELFNDPAACAMLLRARRKATVIEVLTSRFQEIANA